MLFPSLAAGFLLWEDAPRSLAHDKSLGSCYPSPPAVFVEQSREAPGVGQGWLSWVPHKRVASNAIKSEQGHFLAGVRWCK